MVDFLGNEINIGDRVVVISRNSLQVTKVIKFGGPRVYVGDLGEIWWKEYYFRQPNTVISLTALRYKKNSEKKLPCDVLGKKIKVGDTVVANTETYLHMGKVSKITPKRIYVRFEEESSSYEELKRYDNILLISPKQEKLL